MVVIVIGKKQIKYEEVCVGKLRQNTTVMTTMKECVKCHCLTMTDDDDDDILLTAGLL